MRLEAKFENNGILPEGEVSLGLDLLGNFIRNYQMQDSYIISQIPVPMEKDVMILPCLRLLHNVFCIPLLFIFS